MAAARKSSRYGHRDATMILIGYRHGLRASELCDLQWSQVELATGRLHVRRAKNGSPSVHPMQGDEIRALRRLQREQGLSSHVFMTERDGPMTPKAFHALFGRIGARAKMQFPIHPHMLRHGCGATGLARAQKHPAHGALHRAGVDPLQELLARLIGSSRLVLRTSIDSLECPEIVPLSTPFRRPRTSYLRGLVPRYRTTRTYCRASTAVRPPRAAFAI